MAEEVALAVYFNPPMALRSVHMGRLWDRWCDRFPRTEDQPPLPPVAPEIFPSAPPAVSFQSREASPECGFGTSRRRVTG